MGFFGCRALIELDVVTVATIEALESVTGPWSNPTERYRSIRGRLLGQQGFMRVWGVFIPLV